MVNTPMENPDAVGQKLAITKLEKLRRRYGCDLEVPSVSWARTMVHWSSEEK